MKKKTLSASPKTAKTVGAVKRKKAVTRTPPMVTRVARAIVAESRKPSVGISNPQALARAAIKAMRSPTKEVIGWAGMADIGSVWVSTFGGPGKAKPVTFPLCLALRGTGCRDADKALLDAWREMIDAALEAKPYHKPRPEPKSRAGDVPF